MTTGKNTDEHTPSNPREATFGMRRAAEVAGVSVSTIRRNKELLRQHGAVLDPDGWKVPMSALIASGLMRQTTPPDPPAQVTQGADAAPKGHVIERVRELEREALELRHRAELAEERQRAAEAVAREREKALEDARMAMRMLTAAPSPSANLEKKASEEVVTEQTGIAPETAPKSRNQSWWQRVFK